MQERDNLKSEENRLQNEIENMKEKSEGLENKLKEVEIEHTEKIESLNTKISETQKKLKSMTEDRDSRIKRTRLLLDIQKKYEKQQNEIFKILDIPFGNQTFSNVLSVIKDLIDSSRTKHEDIETEIYSNTERTLNSNISADSTSK